MSQLLTIKEVSDFLQIPVKTLYLWRTKRYGPKGKRIGRYIRYRTEDLLAWIDTAEEYAS